VDGNVVSTQIGASLIAVYAIQQLKEAKWFPWLKHNGQVWEKRTLSFLTALGVHTGISHVWNPGPVLGAGVLTLVFPGWETMLIGLWHWINQYVFQETAYQLVWNRVSTTTDAEGAIPARIAPGGAVVIPQTKT
jgi:hypothetical protein